jgi:hypothetical protein
MATMVSDAFRPFQELMIPLSGVVIMRLLQKGDKKIFLIGEHHTTEFCKDKGMTPLCSIIDNYLRSRTIEEPVDFMLETTNELDYELPPLYQTQAIVDNHVNIPYPSHEELPPIIALTGIIVSQYIAPIRYSTTQHPRQKNTLLPNARVHWLDPVQYDPVSRDEKLIYYMKLHANNVVDYNKIDRTPQLYILRAFINRSLNVDLSKVPWAIHEQSAMDAFANFETATFEKIPDRELFLSSNHNSKIYFFRSVYTILSESTFFRKCFGSDPTRYVPLIKLQRVFMGRWEIQATSDNSIDHFYFVLQRFFMDFFTCCRLLKEDKRWFKNIVIYAGSAHTENIEQLLLLLEFQEIPLPPIHYNSSCSSTGGKRSRKQNKNKNKKRRTRR